MTTTDLTASLNIAPKVMSILFKLGIMLFLHVAVAVLIKKRLLKE
jgi:hypothetical protein